MMITITPKPLVSPTALTPAPPSLPVVPQQRVAPADAGERQSLDSRRQPDQAMQGLLTLRFTKQENGRTVIEVRDEEGKLVRTIPPEDLHDVLRREFNQVGLLVDVHG